MNALMAIRSFCLSFGVTALLIAGGVSLYRANAPTAVVPETHPASWSCVADSPGTAEHDVYLDFDGHPIIDPTDDIVRDYGLTYAESCNER